MHQLSVVDVVAVAISSNNNFDAISNMILVLDVADVDVVDG